MTATTVLSKLARPFGSRKVQVALATIVLAILAEFELEVSEELVLGFIGLGISVILGIAHEDAAGKSAGAQRGASSNAQSDTQ